MRARTARRSRRWHGVARRLEPRRSGGSLSRSSAWQITSAIAGDVAYQPGAAYFGRMRGECLSLLLTLSGNRYGRGLVRPGGVGFDLPADMARAARDRLLRLKEELIPVADQMLGNASVQARL